MWPSGHCFGDLKTLLQMPHAYRSGDGGTINSSIEYPDMLEEGITLMGDIVNIFLCENSLRVMS